MELRWIETLKEQRAALRERSVRLAGVTRDRGLGVLGKVRDGALDWHATLTARRSEVLEGEPRWPRFRDLEARVLARVDVALLAFGERVRAEIQRLSQLELGASAPAATVDVAPKPTPPPRKPKAAKTKPKASAKTGNGRGVAPSPKAASTRFVLPIADYDALTVKEILAELPRLTGAQRQAILEHERANKQRKSLLSALEPS